MFHRQPALPSASGRILFVCNREDFLILEYEQNLFFKRLNTVGSKCSFNQNAAFGDVEIT